MFLNYIMEFFKKDLVGRYIYPKLPSNPVKYVHHIIYGRNELSPNVKSILHGVGNQTIISMRITRHPLSFLLTGALDALSFGAFSKHNPYDKLFHLAVIIRTTHSRFLLEKMMLLIWNLTQNQNPRPKH